MGSLSPASPRSPHQRKLLSSQRGHGAELSVQITLLLTHLPLTCKAVTVVTLLQLAQDGGMKT